MDDLYNKIKELSDKHIRLCMAFIQALNDNKPSEHLSQLKEQIKEVLTEIDVLENQRNSNATLD